MFQRRYELEKWRCSFSRLFPQRIRNAAKNLRDSKSGKYFQSNSFVVGWYVMALLKNGRIGALKILKKRNRKRISKWEMTGRKEHLSLKSHDEGKRGESFETTLFLGFFLSLSLLPPHFYFPLNISVSVLLWAAQTTALGERIALGPFRKFRKCERNRFRDLP